MVSQPFTTCIQHQQPKWHSSWELPAGLTEAQHPVLSPSGPGSWVTQWSIELYPTHIQYHLMSLNVNQCQSSKLWDPLRAISRSIGILGAGPKPKPSAIRDARLPQNVDLSWTQLHLKLSSGRSAIYWVCRRKGLYWNVLECIGFISAHSQFIGFIHLHAVDICLGITGHRADVPTFLKHLFAHLFKRFQCCRLRAQSLHQFLSANMCQLRRKVWDHLAPFQTLPRSKVQGGHDVAMLGVILDSSGFNTVQEQTQEDHWLIPVVRQGVTRPSPAQHLPRILWYVLGNCDLWSRPWRNQVSDHLATKPRRCRVLAMRPWGLRPQQVRNCFNSTNHQMS